MIEAVHLTKSYGSLMAVSDVSFSVARGEVVGFLGPNGAGKTTTLRMLAGFLGPTSGSIRIAGFDMKDDAIRARAALGYMPETAPLYPEMRVSEYMQFRAQLKGIEAKQRRGAIQRVLQAVRVDDVADVPIGHLSKGYRQRVALADAIVGSPPVVILDEPTSGLDPNQIRDVRALIRDLAQQSAVLFSTHILSEAEITCSRALVISEGRLVAEGTMDELRAGLYARGVRIDVRSLSASARQAVEALRGVERVRDDALDDRTIVTIEYEPGCDAHVLAETIVQTLVREGTAIREVTPQVPNLEQAFAKLTAGPRIGEGG